MDKAAAYRLLNDDGVKSLFGELRAAVYRDFAATQAEDIPGLQRQRLKLECLDDIEGTLRSLAHDHTKESKR